MVIGKRAQFFLLAAVIISAVVISLGVTANRATINREPGNFYDFSYEVKREAGGVLDYEIYNNIDDETDLAGFVDLLATDIKDKDPESSFLFLYGNNQSMKLRNYGSQNVNADGELVPGSGEVSISKICYPSSCFDVKQDIYTLVDGIGEAEIKDLGESLTIIVDGYNYTFPVSRHRQVIFIMQKKGVDDESFIAVA